MSHINNGESQGFWQDLAVSFLRGSWALDSDGQTWGSHFPSQPFHRPRISQMPLLSHLLTESLKQGRFTARLCFGGSVVCDEICSPSINVEDVTSVFSSKITMALEVANNLPY